jgi:hypothetical protein
MADRIAPQAEARFRAGVELAGRFFIGDAPVHRALTRLIALLESSQIDYAIAGALALNEYGYLRATSDIDLLLRREDLERVVALGEGWLEKFPGSRGLRDTEENVPIDVLLAGDFPGDGLPKPVRFPYPDVGRPGRRGRFLPIEKLVEMKLASGLSAPHRLRDLADVLELVRAAGLSRSLAEQLDPSVRTRYEELWQAAQTHDAE